MSRSRLDIIVKTIAALAVSTDILGLLVNVCPAQKCFLGILKRVQTDRTQVHEGCRIDFVYIVTAHRFSSFYRYVRAHRLRFCTLGGRLKSCLGFLPLFVLDAPGRVGTFWRGFAPLHRPFGRPAFFVAGRELRKYHCLEVPEGCLFTFQGPLASGLSLRLGDALAVTL